MALHTTKTTSLKRLLERSQASAAAQLHALQAEVAMLRSQLAARDQKGAQDGWMEECICGSRRKSAAKAWENEGEEEELDLVKALIMLGPY